MLQKFQKYWGFGLACLAIVGCYFLFRIPSLTLQPIFADEAIYIRWAQVMRAEPTLRFVSLTDGKTPLFMWVLIPVFKVFHDPLLAGRILSVLAGFGTLLGGLMLGGYFFNKKVGLWAAFLIATTPYLIFFDRMALVDSMLAAFGIWSVVLALLVVRFRRLDLAMFLGFCMGGGMLTKTPGYFNVLVSPIVLITFGWKKTMVLWERLKVLLLMVVGIATAMFIYNLMRLGPGFSSLSSRNSDYIHSVSRLWEIPFDPLTSHFRDMGEWFPIWLGWPVITLICIGFFTIFMKRNLVGLVICGWALIPLVVEASLLKTFTTRYILSSIPLLLVVAAVGADWLTTRFHKWVGLGLIAVVLFPSIWFVYLLATKPEDAPMPRESHRGYFEDWTAGYGLREIAEYLENVSSSRKIMIGTGGTFGTLPDGLRIYFDKNPNTSFSGGNDFYYQELRTNARNVETYFVVNSEKKMPQVEGLELLKSYPKANGQEKLDLETRLYRVLPFNTSKN